MNPEATPISPENSIGLMMLVVFNPLIALLAYVVLAHVSFRAASLSARFQFVREFAWLMVPFVVIASFGLMTDSGMFLSGWDPPTNTVKPDSSPVRTADSRDVNRPLSSARPSWVDQPRVVEGDCERIVLISQQYSTRDEAEHELRFAAVKLVEEDLRRFQTGRFRPQSWRPAADDVIAHAVRSRYDDVAEIDFGSFTHPMHRVCWQVELSPAVRIEFMPAWRRAVTSFRIPLVAAVASGFAMAASASLMYFRLDSLTQGRARGALKLLTGSTMAGWLGLLATFLSRVYLW